MSKFERRKSGNKKLLWTSGVLTIILAPILAPILTPIGDTIASKLGLMDSPSVETINTKESQIEETKTENTAEKKLAIKTESEEIFDIIQKGLEDYKDKYVKAYNENDMSYIKEFYIDDTSNFYIETTEFIAKSYYENRKIDSLEITLKNEDRKGSTTYDVIVDLVYIYDINGNKEKESVINRHYLIDLTEDNKIVLVSSPIDARGDSIRKPL